MRIGTRADVLRLTSLFCLGISAAIFSIFKPVVLSGYVDRLGFSEVLAGYLIALEILGSVTGTVLITIKGASINRNRFAVYALLVMFTGNLASLFAETQGLLYALRLFTGFGEGIALGLFAATLAAEKNPERYFGVFSVIILFVGALAFASVPSVSSAINGIGAFAYMAAFAFISFCIAGYAPIAKHKDNALSKENVRSSLITALKDGPGFLVFILLSIGVIAFYFAVGGNWPYMGRIGLTYSLNDTQIASIFSAAQIAGVLGALAPAVVGNRFGHMPPILLSILVVTISLLMLIYNSQSALVFTAASLLFMFAWLMFFPYFMGLTSKLDPEGRLSSFVYAIQNVGFLLGPVVCAFVLEVGGYKGILWFGVGCLALALTTLSVASFNVDRDARKV